MNRYRSILIGGGIVFLVVVGVIFFFGVQRSDERFGGTLTFWSFEDQSAWGDIIRAFRQEYPSLLVTYEQKSQRTYETDLLNALAAGRGPDIFAVHHTWVAKHQDKLRAAPRELMTLAQFDEAFVDVAGKDLNRFGVVGGVPLYVDTLALYYNTSIFNSHGVVSPPKTWEEFNETVKRTAIRGEGDTILQAGAALGTQNNIAYADDILETLMLQNGATMVDETGRAGLGDSRTGPSGEPFSPGENALVYYTNFADPAKEVYTWSRREGEARDAFVSGKAAMYIGYAADLPAIRESGVPFNVAPLPQIQDRRADPSYTDTVLARYWAGAVSTASPKPEAAWAFLAFATSRNAQYNYLTHTDLPPSRPDLVDVVVSQDPLLGVFARQSLIAESWFQPSFERVEEIFRGMIEEVNLGRASAQEAVSAGESALDTLLKEGR